MDAEQRQLVEAKIEILQLYYKSRRILHKELTGRYIIDHMENCDYKEPYIQRAIDELHDDGIVIKRHTIKPFDRYTMKYEMMKKKADKYLEDLRRQIEK